MELEIVFLYLSGLKILLFPPCHTTAVIADYLCPHNCTSSSLLLFNSYVSDGLFVPRLNYVA